MIQKIIFILWIISIINCIKEFEDFSCTLGDISNQTVETGVSKNYSIEYIKETTFIFKIEDENSYQVNIYSINCNFEIDSSVEILNQINLNTYSLILDKNNKNISIKPIIDEIIVEEEKQNYEYKKCHLSINSINTNKAQVIIETKEISTFYFQSENINSLNISYEIKEVSNDNFIALFFQFNEKSNFSININCYNDSFKIDPINKNIFDSSYIYIKSDILKQFSNNDSYLNLSINIIKNDISNISVYFKIVEKEMISMLQKDALNYGFITTETMYQYFYLEVFKEEEGEIMLHNKRFYGELIAKIITKDENNNIDLFNSSIYPIAISNDTNINTIRYNPHSLKLSYNYNNTLNCSKGCYILITYKQEKSEGIYPIIGYEFTLLSRSWDYSDYNHIIDIPFNEYILGAFEKDSITHHYYSIPIPDDAEKIIIQIEGNYIDCFIGEGRKKINTMKIRGNDRNLEIIKSQNVISLDIKELNFNEKIISFAFRSKDFFSNIFSFYYFRVLYVQNNIISYFSMDSHLGNLCLPEYDNNTQLYHCHLMFANKYDELSTKFSISSYNQGEYTKIYITKIYKNGNKEEEYNEMFYRYYNNTNDIDYYYFTFEFENSEIKNIISSLHENIKYYYPQIYSSQMFYINTFIKTCLYKVTNNYILIYNYIFNDNLGYGGHINITFLNGNTKTFYSNRNFRGKPFSFDIDSNITYIRHRIGSGDLLFSLKLEYNMRNKGIMELKSGETQIQFMESGYFPLYYYLKIKNDNYINIDVNLRLNSNDDSVMKNSFDIKGYLLDENTIKKLINGQNILLENAINGIYSNQFKIGFLEVNQDKKNDNNYLLIEILNLNSSKINSFLYVGFVTREYYQEVYFMPINQYILETFDNDKNTIRNRNEYHIYVNQRGNAQVLIEMSPEYNDIEVYFTNDTYPNGFKCSDFNCLVKLVTGFKKYVINNTNNDNIYFFVDNPKSRSANYMIRYYYGDVSEGYTYSVNILEKNYIDKNDENITLSLTFDQLQIIYQNSPLNNSVDIYFYITGLLYNKNDNSEKLANTTAFLHEKKHLYEYQTIYVYNYSNPKQFILIFRNIPRKANFIYDLQIKANVFIENNLLNEEFLVFTKEIDLTDIKLEEEEEQQSILWIILGPILGVIFLLLVTFIVIKFIRLKKANRILREDLKSMAYSNEIQKNVINKEKEISNRDLDYELTFI